MSAEPKKQAQGGFRTPWYLSGLGGCVVYLLLLGFAVSGVFGMVEKGIGRLREQLAPESIRAVLASQQAAWNAGDLDGFMAGYWKSDDLKFLSGGDITTGWQATYDRYHAKYVAGDKKMGKLKFDVLEVDVVSGDAVIVRGKWELRMSDGKNPHGLFTLLFRRIDGEWKIVSDHTSAAETK